MTCSAAKRESWASAGAEGIPQGSSRRGTAVASSARKSVSTIAVSWWSVPIRRALSAAGARSSSRSPWPGKPIVKVLGGCGERFAIAATTAAESTPPERKAP